MRKKVVDSVDTRGKRVIVRVDFNVPLDENANITDDLRIRAAMPTLEHLLASGAAVILMSHLGRPKGKPVDKYSLRPVFDYLKANLKHPVAFAADCVGPAARDAAAALKPGEVLLLENLRFHPEEEKNDGAFAAELAALADIYVNDAFGAAHRAHASTEGITRHSPVSAAGFLLKKEIDYLEDAVANARRPFIAVLGGAKVSDKILVIRKLLETVDEILIGGGMAFTFLKALGKNVGASKLEEDRIAEAKDLLGAAAKAGKAIVLPSDVTAAAAFAEDAEHKTVSVDDIPDGWMGLDIGPATIADFSARVAKAGSVIWNGPMGVFEMKPFAAGTLELAKAIAAAGCVSIVGGGDSAAAVRQMGLSGEFSHISTGGGASLELLEGKKLPGVEALNDA